MKLLILLPLLAFSLGGFVVAVRAADRAPDPAPIPIERLRENFLSWKFGMFIHFNVATYHERGWATGYEDPATFAPDKLDCEQWIRAAKSAGMRYAVLTVKHTGGWCLWPSEHTKSHNTSAFVNFREGQGDLVREFVDACRKHGLNVGFYYCFPRDFIKDGDLKEGQKNLRGLPPEAQGTENFTAFIKKQMTELLSQYGKIDLVWIDQFNGDTGSDWADIRQHMKALQPNCLIIANNSLDFSDTDIHSYEYPYLLVRRPERVLPPENNSSPAEVSDKMGPRWFWTVKETKDNIKTAQEIVDKLKLCNERNANYLLNVVPDKSGLIPAYAVEELKEVGELLRAEEQ